MERGGAEMKSLVILVTIMIALLMMPVIGVAQSAQTGTATPPLSQPLVREGTFATKLADALKVGPATNEAEAERSLSAVGIAPKNGWISDYPVTPDIAGELQTSISDAAVAGRIPKTKDSAAKAFQDAMTAYSLSVAPGISDPAANEASPPAYPESEVINNYYYEEGPPVVTYYAPPPDYAYLYSWVPYPFWGWDFWFPGFFVLGDFDIGFHGHHGHHDGHDGHHDAHDGHHGGHGNRESISNHFRDPATGKMSRIDPANRAHGGTFADRGGNRGWTSPAAHSGAQAIMANRSSFASARANSLVSSAANGISRPTSRSMASVSTADRRAATGARTYGSSNLNSGRSFSGQGRTFSRPAYRTQGNFTPSMGGRSFTSPSGSSRSFSAPSAGGRSGGGSFGGMRSSFSGGGRGGGSFGGGRR
jgi:hypothetical protein